MYKPKKLMRKLLTIFLICSAFQMVAQQKDSAQVVEISGVVVTKDSRKDFIPYAHLVIKKRSQVTVSNEEGFFSFAAVANDTITISCIGFKTSYLWVPDSLKEDSYLSIVPLERDTTILKEVTLYPWPTPERFKEEFLAMQLETTEYDIAQRNLAVAALKERAMAMGYSASEIQNFMLKYRATQLYNQGRYYGSDGGAAVIGALSNPFAWAEFFQALKRGDF